MGGCRSFVSKVPRIHVYRGPATTAEVRAARHVHWRAADHFENRSVSGSTDKGSIRGHGTEGVPLGGVDRCNGGVSYSCPVAHV